MMRLAAFVLALTILSAAAYADATVWYEGGMLQKATLDQWKHATPENQLATAGDFIASLNSISDLSKIAPGALGPIRKQADELVACINAAANQADANPAQPVAEVVVLCTVLKNR